MKIIYTKHARERIQRRSLSLTSIEDTLKDPARRFRCAEANTTKFIKQQGTRLYHVVATYLPREKAYLVVSAWVRGEEDQAPLAWRLLTWPLKILWRLIRGKKTL